MAAYVSSSLCKPCALPCQGDPEKDVDSHKNSVDRGQGHKKSQAKGQTVQEMVTLI